MIVRVTDDVSVSVPTGIENWAKESDDNMTEFMAMLNSLVNSVKDALMEKVEASIPDVEKSPYQELYEKQLEEVKALGMTKEDLDRFIHNLIDTTSKSRDYSAITSDDISKILDLFK